MQLNALHYPRKISGNARVAVVAPSGPLGKVEQIEKAIENVRSFGWSPVLGKNVNRTFGYLAGTDAERAADINWAFADDSIDAVWCIRGGYGASRLLPMLDYDIISENPKPLMGYSDITALHAALNKKCGLVSFHSPTARENISEFSRNSFIRTVIEGADGCGASDSAVTLREGVATGHLVGGNVAVFAALIGTDYFPDMDGGILVLEDVNEDIYKTDRLMQQLLQSGAISNIAGIAAGKFTIDGAVLPAFNPAVETSLAVTPSYVGDSTPANSQSSEISLGHVLKDVADRLKIPCVMALPYGHVPEQWTLPIGGLCTLDATNPRLTVYSGE